MVNVEQQVLGFRQFMLRGLEKVAEAWDLVKYACNLKRIHALASYPARLLVGKTQVVPYRQKNGIAVIIQRCLGVGAG